MRLVVSRNAAWYSVENIVLSHKKISSSASFGTRSHCVLSSSEFCIQRQVATENATVITTRRIACYCYDNPVSLCLCVRPSVRHTLALCRNAWKYRAGLCPKSITRVSPYNKSVTSCRGQKSVVCVVSCRFPNSIITTCCQLVADLLAASLTSPHQVRNNLATSRLWGIYGETFVMKLFSCISL